VIDAPSLAPQSGQQEVLGGLFDEDTLADFVVAPFMDGEPGALYQFEGNFTPGVYREARDFHCVYQDDWSETRYYLLHRFAEL
jgi:hypothetical protein